MEVLMKYTLEIEEDLLAELTDLADRMHTDIDTLITACIKAHIISLDILYGLFEGKRKD